MYQLVHSGGKLARPEQDAPQDLIDQCLAAFVQAGTLDLSLDRLASKVGTSKRMLIHYFGTREKIEEAAMTRLEDALRAQFSPGGFPPSAGPKEVVAALWDRTTAPQARGVLLLVMDVSRRAWRGSTRAKAFYAEQQKLWVRLLLEFFPGRSAAEEFLQAFQGAVLTYLITGDRAAGRRALTRIVSSMQPVAGRRRPGPKQRGLTRRSPGTY
jgi:AcrR family transcriptional regulator